MALFEHFSLNDYKRLIKGFVFLFSFKVRNVDFFHISAGMREQIPVLSQGHNRDFLSTKIAIKN